MPNPAGARYDDGLTYWDHSAPLDPSGNNLGAFAVGQTIQVITEVSNSAGTRTSAPRSITLGEPVV